MINLKVPALLIAVLAFAIYGVRQASRPAPQVLAEQIEVSPTTESTTTPTPSPEPTSTPKPTLVPSPTPVTVTVTVTPIPDIVAPADLEPLFTEFANQYHVSANLLKKIADCESHFNRGVVSKNEEYMGMFQFQVDKWMNERKLMGADSNPDLRFGARESIETAAFVISREGPGPWPACSK